MMNYLSFHNICMLVFPLSSTAFETSSLANLIADDGTILLNIPLWSDNKSSKTVFRVGLNYVYHD